MNRAMDGDTVLIQLDPVEKWKQEAVEPKTKSKYDNQKAVEERVVDKKAPKQKV